jgi:hypothetical protein
MSLRASGCTPHACEGGPASQHTWRTYGEVLSEREQTLEASGWG